MKEPKSLKKINCRAIESQQKRMPNEEMPCAECPISVHSIDKYGLVKGAKYIERCWPENEVDGWNGAGWE
jgi:hypothetical protein